MIPPRRRIRAEYALLAVALLLMTLIIGTGVYESYRAKKIDLIGKSEAFFVSTRSINDFDRLKLEATRAKLGDPELGNGLHLAFDITKNRMEHLRIETADVDPPSRFFDYYSTAVDRFAVLEKIMRTPNCDDACLGQRLLPVLQKMHRSLIKMRGAGLRFEVESRDYMAKLHTETIRKIFFTAALFTLLTAMSFILLNRQNSCLRREMKRAEESERRVLEVSDYRAQFLAGMSHEFRTPLNAIKGFSQFLMMPDVSLPESVRRDYIADIEKSACDLEAMTDTVLDLAKIDAGTFEIYEETVDLIELTQDVIRQFATDAERLAVEMPDTLRITCDSAAIKRCVQNLLSNALKFSDETVGLTVINGKRSVEISVRDRGVGIPADEIDAVWTPYCRSTQTRSSDRQGTGLGLPITKELVALHNGQISIRSEVGEGTSIRITLPKTNVAARSNGADRPEAHFNERKGAVQGAGSAQSAAA